MKKFKSFCTVIAVAAAVLVSFDSFGQMDMKNTSTTPAAAELRTNMRKLWEDHVTWTRNVICCLTDDLPGADQAVKRLLKNQEDIGNAIKPVYGEAAGNQLTGLLHDHIIIAADVVKAAKAGDNAALEAANKKWY